MGKATTPTPLEGARPGPGLLAKLLVNNELTKPFNMKTYPPTKGDQEIANAFKELSRLKYGRDKNIVNREIMDRTKITSVTE